MKRRHSPENHSRDVKKHRLLKAAASLGAFVGLSSLLIGGVEAGRAHNDTVAIQREHSIKPGPELTPDQEADIELTLYATHINVPHTEAARADHTKNAWTFGLVGGALTVLAGAGGIGAERTRRRVANRQEWVTRQKLYEPPADAKVYRELFPVMVFGCNPNGRIRSVVAKELQQLRAAQTIEMPKITVVESTPTPTIPVDVTPQVRYA